MFTEKSRHIDSASVSPSVHSSEERPRSRATSQLSRPQSQPSRSGMLSFILFIDSLKTNIS